MTLHEALDECTICDLFNKNVSDEHKMKVIDRIMSAPNTKVPKAKLSCIIAWLLKKVEWQEQQIVVAKEIIDHLLDFESMAQERGMYISDELRNKANEFLEADE